MKYIKPFFESDKSDQYILEEINSLSHILEDEGFEVRSSIMDVPEEFQKMQIKKFPNIITIRIIRRVIKNLFIENDEYFMEYLERVRDTVEMCGIDLNNKKHFRPFAVEYGVNSSVIRIMLIRK